MFEFIFDDMFRGRLNRSGYTGCLFFYVAISIILEMAIGNNLISIILSVMVSWWGAAFTAKRLHDLNYSGWLQIVPPFIVGGLLLIGYATDVIQLIWLGIALVVAYLAWLIFMPGTDGVNNYGQNIKSDKDRTTKADIPEWAKASDHLDKQNKNRRII